MIDVELNRYLGATVSGYRRATFLLEFEPVIVKAKIPQPTRRIWPSGTRPQQLSTARLDEPVTAEHLQMPGATRCFRPRLVLDLPSASKGVAKIYRPAEAILVVRTSTGLTVGRGRGLLGRVRDERRLTYMLL